MLPVVLLMITFNSLHHLIQEFYLIISGQYFSSPC